jgi:uncharacterized protein YdhG (YjbR/CyaY superfamily)
MDSIQNIKFRSVEEYLASIPQDKRTFLEEIRIAIKQIAPQAEEIISYNMPAFSYYGILLYYAAHRDHIGFYPGNAKLIPLLSEELKGFKTSKGTIRIPYREPFPIELIKKIAEKRAGENLEKFKKKLKKKG